MGHEHIETPHLDRLAAESFCFTRGYASGPLCSPSLASIITGLYAHQHGITGNDPAFEYADQRYSANWRLERQPYFDKLKESFYKNRLLTEYLAEEGYRSLQTGKWWLGSWEEGHFDQGMTHGDPLLSGRHGDEGLKIGREGLDPIFNFIDQSQDEERPFFIWYAPFLPHAPHNPPDSLLQKYLTRTSSEPLASYWAMCEWFDKTCGDLVDYIDAQGLKEETLVIYTSDNGWIQDPEAKNRYAPRSKRSPYEMGIRTPFMLRWPGTVPPKRDSTTQVSNIDIVPTILSASQIDVAEHLPGIDLFAEEERNQREIIFAEAFEHDITDVLEPNKSLQYRIALAYPWKIIVPDTQNIPGAGTELFNLERDPHEKSNIARKFPERVVALRKGLDRWWKPD